MELIFIVVKMVNHIFQSLMAEWLRRRRLRDMKCTLHNLKCTVHNLEVMGSNRGQVELGVCSTSV